MRFIGAKFTRVPQLIFEYVPEGALGDHNDISANEGVQILCQCLSALAYLHRQEPPIVHRDIKPDNILVQHRYAGEIFVKFGDFGISREGRDPTTVCGFWRYLAPEIYNEIDKRKAHHKKGSYTLAVDIWSLGVTVFECVYDLPFQNTTGVTWCQEIVKKLTRDLQRNQDDLKQFLWDTMVIMAPEQRQPAQYCHEQILLIAGQDSSRSPTPTPASYAQGYELLVGQYSVADDYNADQPNVALEDAHTTARPWPSLSLDEDDNDNSAENQRYTGADGPPPDSQASASFHESWLQDLLHLLGGGSAVAAIGQGISDSNSRDILLEKTPRFPDTEDFSLHRGIRERGRLGNQTRLHRGKDIGSVVDTVLS